MDTEQENKSYTFAVTRPTTVLKGLLNKGPKEIITTFTIEEQTVASCIMIAEKAVQLPKSILQGGAAEVLIPLYKDNLPKMVWIIAAAVANYGQKPSDEVITLLTKYLTPAQIFEGCYEAFEAMNMQAFYNGIKIFQPRLKIIESQDQTENI